MSTNKRDRMRSVDSGGGEDSGASTGWSSCHVVWGLCYVTAGAVQLVAGLFALLSLPVLGLGSNIWTGAWNMIAGIGSALLAGLADGGVIGAGRQEVLLYASLSVLGANAANLVLLEAGEWSMLLADATRKEIAQRGLAKLVHYARMSTSLSTAMVLVAALVDSHISFCLLQTRIKRRRRRRTPEADLEYIMPRKESHGKEPIMRSRSSSARHLNNAAAQSWVFDGGPTVHTSCQPSALGTSLDNASLGGGGCSESGSEAEPSALLLGRTMSTSPPTAPRIVVRLEPAPVEDRALNHMKSFSRTPSPTFGHPAFYEYSNETSPARSRLYTADNIYHQRVLEGRTHRRSESVDNNRPQSAASVHAGVSPHPAAADKIQYASLMLELEQVIQTKRPSVSRGGGDEESSSSGSSGDEDEEPARRDSDAEFSKELEAALQMLQDLGSPATIDTPTEPNVQLISSRNNSEANPSSNGKNPTPTLQSVPCSQSASSSGYSSPAGGSSLVYLYPPIACSIRQEGAKAVVSLYPAIAEATNTLVATATAHQDGDLQAAGARSLASLFAEVRHTMALQTTSSTTTVPPPERVSVVSQEGGVTTISIRSPPPHVCSEPWRNIVARNPEFANALYDTESLVSLSELELLARHCRIKAEQKLAEHRALGTLRRASHSSTAAAAADLNGGCHLAEESTA